MKRLFLIVSILSVTCSMWAASVIMYTATQALNTTTNSTIYGLHTDAFNVGIASHTFTSGVGTITFKGTLTTIKSNAFDHCAGLTSVVLPDALTTIEKSAFALCADLESISIPRSVTSIATDAISYCTGLLEIVVDPDNSVYDSRNDCNAIIRKSDNALILGCKNTIIPNGVTSIGEAAFWGAIGLTSINIPEGVVSIGKTAFQSCSGLTSVQLPSTLTSLGEYAFGYCTSLTSFTISDGVTDIANYAFRRCTALKSITVGESVSNIASWAFQECSSLRSVTIKSYSLLNSGTSAITFFGGGIKNCIIGDNITRIGSYAFYGYTALESITIPNSVTNIGSSALSGCTGLNQIRTEAATPPTISSSTFANVNKSIPVYVAARTANQYRVAPYWSDFTNIYDIYTVTLESAEHGSVSGPEWCIYDSVTTITANADEGYHFVQWSDGDTNNPRSVHVTNDTTLIASFAINSYTVTLSGNNGTLSGSGTYLYNDVATIAATADSCYHFVRWSDDNTDNPRSLQVTDNINLSAVFVGDSREVTASAGAHGSVSGSGTCHYNDTVTITATGDAHYHFAQWSDGNTDNPRTIIVTSDTTLTATFAINSYTLALSTNNPAWGTVSGAGTYEYGTRVTMTATASEDRCFVQWSDGNTQNPRNIIMTQDTTIQAIFREYYLENGYEYVDLNLPSGLKWATCNVGATTPEGYGNDFMWGDTKWYTGNDFYTFSFYHYGGTYTSQGGRIYTKYNGTDKLTVLEPQDDAAAQNMGGYWHIPSRQDWMELYNECTWTWTTHNGINGYEVKSKTNNNLIFLPTIIGVYPYNTVNQTGLYWTSELSDSYVSDAYSVRFSSTSINCPSTSTRYYGLAVRAVCPPTIRISAYASDTTMGQVTGAGTYIENATVTLVAVPAFGYHFVGWSDGVTTATRTFSATTPVSLTADFAINQYTLTLGTNNPAGGTVSGGGTYTHGTQVTVEATANEGYQFVRWSDRSTLNPHRIVMTDTMTLIAEFQPLCTITLQTSNPAWGTVSDGGVYPANSTVTLTATPATGYYFVGWSDGVTTNPRVLTVLSDSTLTAEFDMIRKENGYQYIDMGLPSGTRWATCNVGASSPEGYGNYFMWGDPRPKYPGDDGFNHACNCGVNGRCVYTSSDKMTTLLPRHDAASTQMGGEWRMPTAAEWTELRNQCTWTWTQINGVKGYEVRSKVNNHCIFLPAAGYCDYSNNALQSPSMMGYTGRYWSSECSSSTYCAYYTYMSSAMVVENIYEQVYGDIYKASSVRAVCPPTQYKVTLLTQDANRGTVSGSGNYAENRTATITATAKTGYHFTAWSDGNTDNPRTITVTEDVTLTASFDPNQYLLTTLTDGNGTVTPGGTYDYLTTVDLYATPNAGYHFVRWSDGNTQNPRRVTILRDCSYTAQFSNQYILTIQSSNTTMGGVSGGGQYTVNMPVTITATAADGYHFVQWSDGNKDNPRTVVVSGDATLTAQFAINQYSVLVEPNESLWGTVEGAGEYDHGSIVTLIAVPKPGYVFVDWSDGARYNPYVLYLTDELYMMANFTAKTGWDNVESGAAPEKIWINGSIYIRIGDALYDMLGNKFETTGR